MRSASAASSGVLTLKNGSTGAVRPVGDGDAVTGGPDLDLVQALLDQRLAQIVAQRHRPQPDHRMPPFARAGAGERLAGRLPRRRAAGRPDRPAGTGSRPARSRRQAMAGACAAAQSSPARMPASGPAKSGTSSGTTGKPVSAKRAGSPLALRMMPAHCGVSRVSTRSRMVVPPIRMQRLVAAAHAPRQPAGEHEAEGRRLFSRHAPPPCAGAWRSPPPRRRGPGRTRCGPRRRARRSACRARGRSA